MLGDVGTIGPTIATKSASGARHRGRGRTGEPGKRGPHEIREGREIERKRERERERERTMGPKEREIER